MGRRYSIEILSADGQPIKDARGNAIGPFESKGRSGALDIQFDTQTAGSGLLTADTSNLVIRGLPMAVLKQSVNLYEAVVRLYAGFDSVGLPLAKNQAAHYGMILQGQVFTPFANWQGINQSLNLGLINYTPVTAGENNFVFMLEGQQGEDLETVVLRGMLGAFPDTVMPLGVIPGIVSSVMANLILPETIYSSPYTSLAAYSQAVNRESRRIAGRADYRGIEIFVHKDRAIVTDFTTTIGASVITLSELIGQPTWVAADTISIKVPMRADLNIGDRMTLQDPSQNSICTPYGALGAVLANNNTYAAPLKKTTFSGDFVISSIRHVGAFRDRSADAWVTVIEALSLLEYSP